LVGAERRPSRWEDLIAADDDVAIAAITAAELLVGVEMADARHRQARQSFVEGIFATLPIEDYDLAAARSHADLLAHTRRTGRIRGAHDLIIAATAVSRERIVVSPDVAAFEDLPGVVLRRA
jgi:tRNA(fMet)-specific endonuclease VapC